MTRLGEGHLEDQRAAVVGDAAHDVEAPGRARDVHGLGPVERGGGVALGGGPRLRGGARTARVRAQARGERGGVAAEGGGGAGERDRGAVGVAPRGGAGEGGGEAIAAAERRARGCPRPRTETRRRASARGDVWGRDEREGAKTSSIRTELGKPTTHWRGHVTRSFVR